MLALIDDFKFEIRDATLDSIKSTTDFKFQTHSRLANFDTHQAVGEYEETIEISGELIVKSQKQLNNFEEIAKAKEQISFITLNEAKQVIITSLEKERSNFLQDGAFLKQSYKINMRVVGGR